VRGALALLAAVALTGCGYIGSSADPHELELGQAVSGRLPCGGTAEAHFYVFETASDSGRVALTADDDEVSITCQAFWDWQDFDNSIVGSCGPDAADEPGPEWSERVDLTLVDGERWYLRLHLVHEGDCHEDYTVQVDE